MSVNLFTKQFWAGLLEAVVVTASASFTGAVAAAQGNLSLHTLVAAGTTAGIAALYTFVKQFSVVQSAKANATASAALGAGKINAVPPFRTAEAPVQVVNVVQPAPTA